MDVSVIVINYNSGNFLDKCLQSVYRQTNSSLEVFVVDNNSSDDSVEMIKEKFSQLNLIINNQNLGFARACNQAIKKAKGKYLFFLNPDTRLINKAIDVIIKFMDLNPEVAASGGQLLNPDGSKQESVDIFPRRPTTLAIGRLLDIFWPHNTASRKGIMRAWDKTGSPLEVDVVKGADLMVRRSALEKVGLFDEDYFMYAEETDLCYRIKKAGYKIFLIPEAKIIHWGEGSSLGRLGKEGNRSLFKFYRKHYGELAELMIKLVSLTKGRM